MRGNFIEQQHTGAVGDAPTRARVLLLDEVAAHLDPLRREALFEQLRGGPAQVWITGTEATPFDAIAREASCWRVADGQVQREPVVVREERY